MRDDIITTYLVIARDSIDHCDSMGAAQLLQQQRPWSRIEILRQRARQITKLRVHTDAGYVEACDQDAVDAYLADAAKDPMAHQPTGVVEKITETVYETLAGDA